MTTEAASQEHIGEERMESNDAILVKVVVVIVAGPGAVELNSQDG